MIIRNLTAGVLAISVLAACQQGPNKEQLGTGLGAILGGVVGSNVGEGQGRTAAIIGGTMLGAWMGSSIGSSLDRADMMYYNRAQNNAYNAPMGESITWDSPETGHRGTVTPIKEGHTNTGNYCREFQQTITIDGRTEQAYGQACRQPDGSWKILQ